MWRADENWFQRKPLGVSVSWNEINTRWTQTWVNVYIIAVAPQELLSISNHQELHCLFSRLFRLTTKERAASLDSLHGRSVMEKFKANLFNNVPDSKVHGANMGPIWGRQDPGGPHVGPWTLLSGTCTVFAYYVYVFLMVCYRLRLLVF